MRSRAGQYGEAAVFQGCLFSHICTRAFVYKGASRDGAARHCGGYTQVDCYCCLATCHLKLLPAHMLAAGMRRAKPNLPRACWSPQAGGWSVPAGVDAREWYIRGAGVDGAWAITRDADLPTVVVAVVDGGFDTRHPDLAGALWANPGEVPGNGIDDDGNGRQCVQLCMCRSRGRAGRKS